MKTNESTNACPKCGAPVPPEAPQGLCPQCVFAQAAAPEAAPTATSQIPSLKRLAVAFPQLQILELIGRGGMGFVFKARQPHLDRFVALKLLPDSLAHDAHFAERFNREGRTLARLNHPNIVSIFDFGQAGGFYFLLMEYVDGVNLRQAMQAGRFSPSEALAIVPKICEALQYAHEEGILHRDIKPENILLDSKGRVKIADFGIAKIVGEDKPDISLTATGAALGTPHYMAPEQFEKPGTVDHRADIYSLGVVFYEMLTGELPIGRFSPPSQRTPVDPRVDDVVMRTLEKEREKRFQSAGEMQTNVEHLTESGAGAFQAATVPPRMGAAQPTQGTIVIGNASLVKRPAQALLATGILNWVGSVFVVALLAYTALGESWVLSPSQLVAVGALILLSSTAIIFGALKMMKLQTYPLAIAASVLAMITTPGSLIGLPIGLWALVTLRRPEVRAAFQSSVAAQRYGVLKWVCAVLLLVGGGIIFMPRHAQEPATSEAVVLSKMHSPSTRGLIELNWKCSIPPNHLVVFGFHGMSNDTPMFLPELSGFYATAPDRPHEINVGWGIQDGKYLSPSLASQDRWDARIGGVSTSVWLPTRPVFSMTPPIGWPEVIRLRSGETNFLPLVARTSSVNVVVWVAVSVQRLQKDVPGMFAAPFGAGGNGTNWFPLPGSGLRQKAVGQHEPASPPWIRFTFTAVELREVKGVRWLAIDYLDDVHGECQKSFPWETTIPGFKAETRATEFVTDAKGGSPSVRHQRIEYRMPDSSPRDQLERLRDELEKKLQRKSFRLELGEDQVPLTLFELPGVEGGSLKARIKVMPPLKVSPEPPHAFGPVLEKFLPELTAIDLHSRQTKAMPSSLTNRYGTGERDIEISDWLEREGMDFAFLQHRMFHGRMQYMGTFGDEAWNNFSPEQLDASLHPIGKIVPFRMEDRPEANFIHGFKTRNGRLGLLKIIHTDNPRGVTIRYKLVQSPRAGSAMPTASASPSSLLQFRLVADEGDTTAPTDVMMESRADGSSVPHRTLRTVLLDGSAVGRAGIGPETNGHSTIEIELTAEGARQFAAITAANVNRRLAIVSGGRVLSAPTIRTPITGGKLQVSGNMSSAEIRQLVATLNGTPASDARMVIDVAKIEPLPPEIAAQVVAEVGPRTNSLDWRFICLIPPNHMAQILFVRWTNGIPTIAEGRFSAYHKVGKTPAEIELFISHVLNGPTIPEDRRSQWTVSPGMEYSASTYAPADPPYRRMETPARMTVRPGHQRKIPLVEFGDAGRSGAGRPDGVDLHIILQPLATPAIRTVPTEKDYGHYISGHGLIGTREEALNAIRDLPIDP